MWVIELKTLHVQEIDLQDRKDNSFSNVNFKKIFFLTHTNKLLLFLDVGKINIIDCRRKPGDPPIAQHNLQT